MFTSRLRFLTAGESHGPSLTGVLEGMPAGVALSEATIAEQLCRRQQGFGAGGRMKIESDRAQITAGVMAGYTTGAPIAFVIENRDYENWRDREIAPMTVPRPGHADLTGAAKYGYRELRLSLERASARETAARVAVGAICRALLSTFGVEVGGYVTAIGEVDCPFEEPAAEGATLLDRAQTAEQNDVRCPHPSVQEAMRAAITQAIKNKDTLGGVVETFATGVPVGLGSYVQYDRRIDARIAGALMSVNAAKGVEIGGGFDATRRHGTATHDELRSDDGKLIRDTNRAGGVEGGITNGAPLVARTAIKPIATTLRPLGSVDLATGAPATTNYERSDYCQVPRAVPICEAMVAIVLADALSEKLGGDSIQEMTPRFEKLRGLHVDELPMDNRPWRFGYE